MAAITIKRQSGMRGIYGSIQSGRKGGNVKPLFDAFREAEKAIALVEETEGIGPLEISLTLDEIEELDEKRRKLASFCDEIHYEISQMVDRPFTARIAELLEAAYALDPSDFKAETSGTTYNHMISLKDLMMATTIDEQLKKDFDSKFNTLDHDKPSKDLKDAIREARILEGELENNTSQELGFDPDKDYATLIADAIRAGNYSNLQKYVNERDAKIASDREKYKDAQTTGAYLLFLGYVSVREYLNRKGYANDQITYENGKVCVIVNKTKYPLDIEGIALTGHTNYASKKSIESALVDVGIADKTPIQIAAENFWNDRQDWTYPLESMATQDPLTSDNVFGYSRSGGTRSHAGIDFHAEPGTKVLAMTGGTVISVSYFDVGLDQVTVKNNDGTIVRYTEISVCVEVGDNIKQGQKIGTVQLNNQKPPQSMLHLEVYMGIDKEGNLLEGSLTTKPRDNEVDEKDFVTPANYNRRRDLIDPSGASKLKLFSNK
ncbi:MAG: M23 family metallopeptidase [Acetivibrionales bacterium]|jgi:murein DD-endopeptidase MepM/ murein hydrolase activator NlpD